MNAKRFNNVNRILTWLFGGLLLTGVLIVVALNLFRNRNDSASNACVNNLRQIDGGKQEWALENKKSTNDIPTLDDIRPYVGRGINGGMPQCPKGGIYILRRVGELPRCSIGGRGHSIEEVDSYDRAIGAVIMFLIVLSAVGLGMTVWTKKIRDMDLRGSQQSHE